MSGDMLVNADTGEVIAEMTPDEARLLTDRMHTGLGVLTELYVEAYTGRAWAALGHPSWDAYLAAEFGRYQLRLPAEERDETIASMRAAGLSIRAIAATGVASKNTVERTIAASGVPKGDTSTTGRDGKTYPAGESDGVRAARERREREAAETAEPVDYGKCTAGFDCAAKATAADAMCDWHRKKANEASATDVSPSVSDEPQQVPAPAAAQDPGKAGAPESRAAATGSTGASSAGAGDGGGTGDVLPTPPAETLPADWRDLIGHATFNADRPFIVMGTDLGDEEHTTLDEALADAESRIDDCLDDTWSEDVDQILVARVTHRAVRTVVGRRADMTPEAWTTLTGGRTDVDEWWIYSIEPVDAADQADQVEGAAPVVTLPADWRDLIGHAAYIVRLDPALVAAAATDDDRADLQALTDWLSLVDEASDPAVLAEPQEQN